jgi:AbrB family looped-hinge helix DNA binding protein
MEVLAMLAELRTKSQITLPKDIVNSLGLSEGDKLEVYEKDGMICMMPVAVYPKKYVDELHGEISQLKQNIREGKQPVFDSIDELFQKLEEN